MTPLIDLSGWNVNREVTELSIHERRTALAADEALREWQDAMIAWASTPTSANAAAALAAMDAVHRANAAADEAHLAVLRAERDAARRKLETFLSRGIAAGVSASDIDLMARVVAAVRAGP